MTDGRRTDGRRTTEPAYTISSPGAFGSGELKKNHLHTVEHVVQATFQNMLITFEAQTLQLLF